MKWRTYGAPALPYRRPLQPVVMRRHGNSSLDRRLAASVMFDVLAKHDPDTVNVANGKFTNSIGLIRRS